MHQIHKCTVYKTNAIKEIDITPINSVTINFELLWDECLKCTCIAQYFKKQQEQLIIIFLAIFLQ